MSYEKLTGYHGGNDYGLFSFSSENETVIFDGNGYCSLNLSCAPLSAVLLLRSGDNFYAITSVNKTTADIEALFGGSDIWLCKLRI